MQKKKILNKLLVELFHKILTIEEKALKNGEFSDLSMASMHVVDAIGVESPRPMANIASDIGITAGTLSIAVDQLVKKGYVERQRSEEDRRIVYLSLTEKGTRAYDAHSRFHNEMIKKVLGNLEDQEEEVLIRALKSVMSFFEENY